MARNVYAVILVVVMVALIVAVDVLFLKDHPWLRLISNVGIVVVFLAFFLTLLRRR